MVWVGLVIMCVGLSLFLSSYVIQNKLQNAEDDIREVTKAQGGIVVQSKFGWEKLYPQVLPKKPLLLKRLRCCFTLVPFVRPYGVLTFKDTTVTWTPDWQSARRGYNEIVWESVESDVLCARHKDVNGRPTAYILVELLGDVSCVFVTWLPANEVNEIIFNHSDVRSIIISRDRFYDRLHPAG